MSDPKIKCECGFIFKEALDLAEQIKCPCGKYYKVVGSNSIIRIPNNVNKDCLACEIIIKQKELNSQNGSSDWKNQIRAYNLCLKHIKSIIKQNKGVNYE